MKNQDESVDELLQKLAKKGKKVKLLDESASVKELPRQEDEDEDLGRGEDLDDFEVGLNNQGSQDHSANQSSVKRKVQKIKEEREDEDTARKLREA